MYLSMTKPKLEPGPARGVLAGVIQNHPNRTVSDLR
jgi:hypothetical protein